VSPPLVLASGSAVRRLLLEQAGLTFTVDVADIDEQALEKEGFVGRAERLAREKAMGVSVRHPAALVIGSDQVGFIDDETSLEKPTDEQDARRQLTRMSGRPHQFVSAAAVVRDGEVLAQVFETARVTFRELSDDEVDAYVAVGEWRGSCGAYQIEHRGITLVDDMRGSWHAILGLPLVPLLAALRTHGMR
jgi:septum formation protein